MAGGARLEPFWLADSFLPVGTYTASYDLEQFVQKRLISDADDLRALLSTYLKQQVDPYEPVALRAVYTAARDGDFDVVRRTNRHLTAAALSKEFRKSVRQSGNRLLSLQRELRELPLLNEYAEAVDAGDAAGDYTVVLGIAAAGANIDASETCLLCCRGFMTGLVGIAQRVLLLEHTDARRILHDPQPMMTEVAVDSADRGIGEMSSFAPLIDILSANRERANQRLFMS